ncbi:hypothetical protein [Spirosoma endophyticum]|uniref:Carboxypeptidase regulatory-like domain-containing protein n=1 Tax=Spirosoma endophyticum TaxID=662367 RepID=A0A1I1PK15_9BACT|nr:hypothetical protein [Spirosoma endophyticum]SFD08048.1 hypothetical protein SAMN05216167_103232 [Spirosoma endophyticum]
MNKTFIYLALLLFGFSLTVCAQKPVRKKVKKATTFQGICGNVVEKRGNQMPGPGAPKSGGIPVERDVLIFPLLNISQVDAGDNGFINSVRDAKPVKTAKSDKNGKFCIYLPVGRYSVIVKEPKGLYANLSDTKNNIFPVSVGKGEMANVTVEISHQAVF